MKSARALVPILIVVLLVCTMALTFAWFAQTMEEVKVGNAFTIGDTNYVYLTDGDLPEGAVGTIVGTLTSDKFNGELGFKEDGNPYPADHLDAAYVAEYKIGVFMQGSEDLTLAVNFEGLTVTLGERMTTGVTTQRLWRAVFSKLKGAEGELLFANYEDFAEQHVGTAEKDESGGWVLTEPTGGAEGYVFLADNGRPVALKLDRAMTEQLFRISVARVVDDVPGAYGDEVLFTYPDDVNPDLAHCHEHELRLKIEFGYADENDRGIPFPFADEAFRGCTFGFEVTARAL